MANNYSFEDFLGEEVVDPEGNPIGTFACYWEFAAGEPLLLGIDLREVSGLTHVVPVSKARLNESQSYVQVDVPRETLKRAPCLECGCDLTMEFERKAYEYYEVAVPSGFAPGKTVRPPLRRISRPEIPGKPMDPTTPEA